LDYLANSDYFRGRWSPKRPSNSREIKQQHNTESCEEAEEYAVTKLVDGILIVTLAGS
jgi:hypothetical protein